MSDKPAHGSLDPKRPQPASSVPPKPAAAPGVEYVARNGTDRSTPTK